MKCGFCGMEIPADHVQKSCGLCAGGCRKVHCPYCGHENPATPSYLQRFAEHDKKNDNGEDPSQ